MPRIRLGIQELPISVTIYQLLPSPQKLVREDFSAQYVATGRNIPASGVVLDTALSAAEKPTKKHGVSNLPIECAFALQ